MLEKLELASSVDLLLKPDVIMQLLEEGEDCEVLFLLLSFSFRDLTTLAYSCDDHPVSSLFSH